jgi:hypothetical protein
MNPRASLAIIATAGIAAYLLAREQGQGATIFDTASPADDTAPLPAWSGFDLAPPVDFAAPDLAYDLAADLEAMELNLDGTPANPPAATDIPAEPTPPAEPQAPQANAQSL